MAAYTISDATARVTALLREEGDETANRLVDPTDIVAFLDWACRRYSAERPDEAAQDLTGDGTCYLDLPSGWTDGLSAIVSVEYPLDQTPPVYLDARSFTTYVRPTETGYETVLRFLYGSIALGQQVRVTYTAERSFAAQNVLAVDFDAVCALATSRAADTIAAKYARSHEPLISADVSGGGQTKVQAWQSIARRWQAVWDQHSQGLASPASGVVNWDTQLTADPEWATAAGRDHLTHTRWGR